MPLEETKQAPDANHSFDCEMIDEIEEVEQLAQSKTITQTSNLESKPGSIFKTDVHARSKYETRQVVIPPFGLDIEMETPKKEEHELTYTELRDILVHANEFEWEQYFPRLTTRIEISHIDHNIRLERAGQQPNPLNPDRYLSAPCYWTMVCSQYFPYASYKLAADESANADMLQQIRTSLYNVGEGQPPPDCERIDMEPKLDQREESKMIDERSEEQAIENAEVNWYKSRVMGNLRECVANE